MPTFQTVLRGHLTAADKARQDYAYIPFALPQPARRLHVRYVYSAPISSDETEGGNVIDLGIFDPRGMEFPGGLGFRGWSGSARQEFSLSPTGATPGYLPGPLPAGQYQVILGLYRIWPAGADYEIYIEAELDETAPTTFPTQPDPPTLAPSALPPQPPFWLRGDLQSHTNHSDAAGTLYQLIRKARVAQLDFLAVTDHNTVSHHPHLAPLADKDLLLLLGQEVTTYYGHMNVWGTGRWCDFRCKTREDMAAVINLAHAHGGVCSINHPKTGGPAWEYGADLPVDAMEVWQGPWPHRNTESLALWENLLAQGRRLPVVGGSDYHCPSGAETDMLRVGQPTTWVKVTERSAAAILQAIQVGHASISARPTGPRLDLWATAGGVTAQMGDVLKAPVGEPVNVTVEVTNGAGYTLRVLADGEVVQESAITHDAATVQMAVNARRYVRAEVVGDMAREQLPPEAPAALDLRGWRWALSNPVYVAPE
ncbi:MAG: CehA/McbA family metallohydrolase [Caldilineaceae bacterium]